MQTLAAAAAAMMAVVLASSQQHEQQQPLFVDVGANIGWFMLNAAAAGARVLAFEGTGAAVQVGFTHY